MKSFAKLAVTKIHYISISMLIVVLSGCASAETREARREAQKKISLDYSNCVKSKSIELDDGVGSVADIAMAAIYSCGNFERAVLGSLIGSNVEIEARNRLRETVYPIAFSTITNNRKKAKSGGKNTN